MILSTTSIDLVVDTTLEYLGRPYRGTWYPGVHYSVPLSTAVLLQLYYYMYLSTAVLLQLYYYMYLSLQLYYYSCTTTAVLLHV
jgi:hypothetical protein